MDKLGIVELEDLIYDLKSIVRLSESVADYILSNNDEKTDYEYHCEENNLNPQDIYNNARVKGPHIYAIMKTLEFELEMLEQKLEEMKGE